MAGEDRAKTPDVMADLETDAPSFDFFQALRLFELAHRDRPRLGKAKRGRDEAIRLKQKPYLSFPTSSVTGFAPPEGNRPAELEVLIMGLFGPNGALPIHFTAHAIERRDRHADRSFLDFCTMLQHRFLALFFRAWADARPQASTDRFQDYVASLCGYGFTSQRQRNALGDHFLQRHAGLLAQQSRHPDALARLLRNLLGLPLVIVEFVGGWLDLPAHVQTRLGYAQSTGTLGDSAVIGHVTWQCQHRFRIEVGPLSYADYERLLPGGRFYGLIREAVRCVLGDEFEWDLRLILKRQDVPRAQLGRHVQAGWTAWLATAERSEDADDLTLKGDLQFADISRAK
ncbi:MAG: type VI secretion system baseplate subunit TssG [Pseudomonadota bacterium]